MNKFRMILGIVVSWAIAFWVFWIIFFKMTPWIISLIPADILGEWFNLFKAITYIAIVGIPICIGILGTIITVYIVD